MSLERRVVVVFVCSKDWTSKYSGQIFCFYFCEKRVGGFDGLSLSMGSAGLLLFTKYVFICHAAAMEWLMRKLVVQL